VIGSFCGKSFVSIRLVITCLFNVQLSFLCKLGRGQGLRLWRVVTVDCLRPRTWRRVDREERGVEEGAS
jgi:hypothetical protein